MSGAKRTTRRAQLVIFVKEPRPGRVKTRLAASVGSVQAAAWFRRQSASLIRRLSSDRRWETILAVSPDREGYESRIWPRGVQRRTQGVGDLGARMGRVFRSAPPGPVVIVGADIPDVTVADVAAAFSALGSADATLGPATDGGYWLIGLARGRMRAPAGLFDGVRWSTGHALADTAASLPRARIALLRELRDVDTVEDLKAF